MSEISIRNIYNRGADYIRTIDTDELYSKVLRCAAFACGTLCIGFIFCSIFFGTALVDHTIVSAFFVVSGGLLYMHQLDGVDRVQRLRKKIAKEKMRLVRENLGVTEEDERRINDSIDLDGFKGEIAHSLVNDAHSDIRDPSEDAERENTERVI